MSIRIHGLVAQCWHMLLAVLLLATGPCWAQGGAAPVLGHAALADGRPAELGMAEWLLRIHEASRRRAYIGTFVVSSGPVLTSARIWNICDGEQQMQRVETLSGAPRSTFRRNDQIITFLPETKTAIAEKRESLGLFPELLKSTASPIAQHYSLRRVGAERVAGLDSDVVLLQPKDDLRFGYRVWSEKKSGLVVKLQTLDAEGRVLEQAAFSELQLDAPVSFGKLTQMMENTEGYRVERPELVKTTALAEGWAMRAPVAGFLPMSCYKRPSAVADSNGNDTTLQWIFSDGLASVSIFIEQFDRKRHAHEGFTTLGATHTLSKRLADKAGEWWLTVVGEVPRHTLNAFAQGLERKR